MIVKVFIEEKSKAEIKKIVMNMKCYCHLFNNQSEIITRILRSIQYHININRIRIVKNNHLI